MIVYYNPGCSKCREAQNLLEQTSCEVTFREYLKEPPTIAELEELLQKLGCKASDLVRKSEPVFLEKFANKEMTEEEWIRTMSEHPVLIERPIAIDGSRAVIGRPPALVLDFIAGK